MLSLSLSLFLTHTCLKAQKSDQRKAESRREFTLERGTMKNEVCKFVVFCLKVLPNPQEAQVTESHSLTGLWMAK